MGLVETLCRSDGRSIGRGGKIVSETYDAAEISSPTMPEFGTGVRLRATDPRYLEILDFLWDEAAILDRDDLAEWRDMLDVNLSYRMPVCLTRNRASQETYRSDRKSTRLNSSH